MAGWAQRVLLACRRWWYASTVTLRPAAEVVQRARRGQPRQSAPKRAAAEVTALVCPAGQVTVCASVSMVKSSRVKPPVMRGLGSMGLMAVS